MHITKTSKNIFRLLIADWRLTLSDEQPRKNNFHQVIGRWAICNHQSSIANQQSLNPLHHCLAQTTYGGFRIWRAENRRASHDDFRPGGYYGSDVFQIDTAIYFNTNREFAFLDHAPESPHLIGRSLNKLLAAKSGIY